MSTIDQLKAAHAAATPGEWIKGSPQEPNMAYVGTGDGGWLGLAALYGDTDEEAHANAEFIALAHNQMPYLLGAVEFLEIALELIAEAIEVHIYSDDETPDPDCNYTAFVKDAGEILAKLKGTQS